MVLRVRGYSIFIRFCESLLFIKYVFYLRVVWFFEGGWSYLFNVF